MQITYYANIKNILLLLQIIKMTKKRKSLQAHIEKLASDADAMTYNVVTRTYAKSIFNYDWHELHFYPFQPCYIGQPEEVSGYDGDYVRLKIASTIGILAN